MTLNICESAWSSSNHLISFQECRDLLQQWFVTSTRKCALLTSYAKIYFNLSFLFLGYEECREITVGSILFWRKPKTKGCIWWPSWPCENQDQCLDSRSLYPNKFSPSCFLWLIWLIPIFATGKSLFFRKVASASFHARASLRVSWPKFVLSELFISKFGHSPQASRRSGSIF